MMAELAPLWCKFGNPSRQVRQANCPGLLLVIQSNVCSWNIAKGQENVTSLTKHMNYPSWFFGIPISQK